LGGEAQGMDKFYCRGMWIHLRPVRPNHIETNFGWTTGPLFVVKVFPPSTNLIHSIKHLGLLHCFLSINCTAASENLFQCYTVLQKEINGKRLNWQNDRSTMSTNSDSLSGSATFYSRWDESSREDCIVRIQTIQLRSS
jgi:hypothetical protein